MTPEMFQETCDILLLIRLVRMYLTHKSPLSPSSDLSAMTARLLTRLSDLYYYMQYLVRL